MPQTGNSGHAMLRLPLYDAQIYAGVVTSDQTKRTPNKPNKTHESVRYTMVSMVKGHTAHWGGMSVSVHCTLKISSPEVCTGVSIDVSH